MAATWRRWEAEGWRDDGGKGEMKAEGGEGREKKEKEEETKLAGEKSGTGERQAVRNDGNAQPPSKNPPACAKAATRVFGPTTQQQRQPGKRQHFVSPLIKMICSG